MRRFLIGAAATAALLVAAGPAAAAPCNLDANAQTLYDTQQFPWDAELAGSIDNGLWDAYDSWGDMSMSASPDSLGYGLPADSQDCTREAGDRQLAYPEVTGTGALAGVALSRKLYVPASGNAFARILITVRNTNPGPVTLDSVVIDGNLGSDMWTKVHATSSGDELADTGDISVVSDDDLTNAQAATNDDPALAFAWGYRGGGGQTIGNIAFVNTDDNVSWDWTNVTLGADEAKTFAVFAAQRHTLDEATAEAQFLTSGSAELFAGMTPQERAQVANFPADTDGDGDGVLNAADNCPLVANADQADLDHDGIGDACDADVDGDGVSNVDEALRGSDPAKADSDGDGVADAADACPKQPGKNANGCPGPERDTTKPVLTVKVPSSIKRKTVGSKAISLSVTTNEAATVSAALLGSAKGAHVAKAGDLVLAEATLSSGTGTRTLKLKVSRKHAKAIRSKKYKLRIALTATDASGNTTTLTKTVKVK
jgi:hypothetical protein